MPPHACPTTQLAPTSASCGHVSVGPVWTLADGCGSTALQVTKAFPTGALPCELGGERTIRGPTLQYLPGPGIRDHVPTPCSTDRDKGSPAVYRGAVPLPPSKRNKNNNKDSPQRQAQKSKPRVALQKVWPMWHCPRLRARGRDLWWLPEEEQGQKHPSLTFKPPTRAARS